MQEDEQQGQEETGADTGKETASGEGNEPAGGGGTDFEREREEAQEEIKALEDDPPKDLADWPSGKAKYETFGGPEHETSYDESAVTKLGPSDVRHREGGAVEVGGEEVDDPDEYKGDPIPGGPTDPDAPKVAGEKDLSGESEEDDPREGGDSEEKG